MRNTPQQIPASRSRSSRTETAARSRAPAPPETPSEPISGDRSRPPPPSSSPIPFPHCSISSLSLSPSSICRTSSPRFHESIIQLLSISLSRIDDSARDLRLKLHCFTSETVFVVVFATLAERVWEREREKLHL